MTTSENLRRRLDETDALIAIYDEAIELISKDEVDAARQAVEEESTSEQTHETTSFSLRVTLRGDGDEGGATASVDAAQCKVTIRMPSGYPEKEPLELVSLMSDRLSREEGTALLQRAREFIPDAGEECAYQIISDVQQLFKELVAKVRSIEVEKRAADVKDEEETDYHAVISIDHMNESREYLRIIKKWCESNGLSARVYHKPPCRESGKRVEGVMIALRGSNNGIKSFLTRLRTDLVDVDSKGNKCKERNSTLLCHRKSTTVKDGERPIADFDGFLVEPYRDETALEDALAKLNLLHVGDGSQRFV